MFGGSAAPTGIEGTDEIIVETVLNTKAAEESFLCRFCIQDSNLNTMVLIRYPYLKLQVHLILILQLLFLLL